MVKKRNLNPYCILYMKINSMWVVNINIESKTIQILKDNKENVLMMLDRQKFLNRVHTALAMKKNLINLTIIE